MHEPIAIVGLSALFPGSSDVTGFWRDILAGKDLLTDVPATHWRIGDYYDADPNAPDKTYAKRGGFLRPVDFDALGFGVPPSTLPATDTSQLLALIVAQTVLQDAARERFETMDRSRVSVILGVTSAQELLFSLVSRLQKPVWVKALRESGLPEDEVQAACARIAAHYVPWQEASFPGLLGNVVAGRIANRLNLGGTNCVTDAACASSLSALSMAVAELQLGHSDLAITGGVDTLNDIFMYLCFSKTPALSPSGDCRPFSDKADGTMLGEGLGMLALKRLGDAERVGDRIYALLRSVGSASDGRSKSVYAPVPEGQARALNRAYEAAGFSPRTVELVEAHGTGTKAGDIAEFDGLRSVFAIGADRQWCALGSVKSQIGHTKAAAGAAGLIKAVLALQHKTLPPTIKIDRPDPRLEIEQSPFYLNSRARPWVRGSGHPRRAAVSSFGFGGSNFHATLEEYRGELRAERLPMHAHDLVLFGAETADDLLAVAREALSADLPLPQIATLSRERWRSAARHRLAIVTSDAMQLRDRFNRAATRMSAAPTSAFSLDGASYGVGAVEGKVAFLFPGQGSQYLNMGAALTMQFDAAMAAWDLSAEVANAWSAGARLHEIVFPIPVFDDASLASQRQRLTATEWAQPALAAHALALLAILRDLGLEAAMTAGHSFGELTALHAAGAFDAATLLRLARARGESMRNAATTAGAMSAVSTDIEIVRTVLAELGNQAVIANHNAPQQVVISGSTVAIEAAEASLQAKGIGYSRLSVASAFHSPIVAAASAEFAQALGTARIAHLSMPVYANGTALPYSDSSVCEALAQQLQRPVRFVEMIEQMYADDARIFVEIGPGSVLSGLCGAILGDRRHHVIALDRKGADGLEAFLLGLSQLAALGVPLSAARLFADVRTPAAAPRSKHAVAISGSNVGKPYPPADGQWPPPNPPRSVSVSEPRRPDERAAPAVRAAATAPDQPSQSHPLTTHAAMPSTLDSNWLSTFQALQQQTAAAHEAYQRALTDSHTAYLRVAETALAGLSGMLGGVSVSPNPGLQTDVATTTSAPPISTNPLSPTPAPAPAHAAFSTEGSVSALPDTATAPAAPVALRTAVDDGASLGNLLLRIVADKTGYPVDMLNLGMDLEGDLGVDSIKRVEILAAIDERAPHLPKVDRTRLGSMRTLAEIVTALEVAQPQPDVGDAKTQGHGAQKPAAKNAGNTSLQASEPLADLMLQVVADKTGYPVDMLNLDMDLEGDLGVDSIKRVEILAAIDERAPQLPKVDRSRLGAMRTLAQIVAALGGAAQDPNSQPQVHPPTGKQPPSASGRFEVELIPAPPSGFAMPGLLSGEPVWIVGESTLAHALAFELAQRGVDATAAQRLPNDAQACVYIASREYSDVDAAMRANIEAFAVARALAPRLSERPGLFVTVQDTGAFGFERAPAHAEWAGGLAALIKTCALEWPQAAVKAIDIAFGERDDLAAARAIADELLTGGGEIEVALGASGRRTLRSVARQARADSPLIAPEDVIVVSGGARGVTAACMIEWARTTPAQFVLLGRTELIEEPAEQSAIADADLGTALLAAARGRGETWTPAQLSARVHAVQAARDVRRTLAALKAHGARAYYRAVPIEDRERVAQTLAQIRAELGPIRGVIHAAGVLADKRIAEKTDAQFASVFGTKVNGLRALLDATGADPLKLLVAFSSVSARCGNAGQADYAMANEVLNKVLQSEKRRRPDLRVKALAWGPWEGGMVSPGLRDRFAALGVPMIALPAGAHMFAQEMGDAGALELVLGGEPRAQALLSSGSQARVDALEIRIDRSSHAWLAGHSVAGMPVLPVALIAEWMARAVRSWRPGLQLLALHELKVLKGIRLRGFENSGDRLRIEGTPHGARAMQLRVLGARGEVHYSARAELGEAPLLTAPGLPALKLDLWHGAPLYEDLLFHRDSFELIEHIDGVSDVGIAAQLRGMDVARWTDESWHLDAAAIDGGLQMAVLYGQRMLGGPNLPTSIAEVRCHAAPCAGPIQAVATSRQVTATATTMDIVYADARGQRIAELIGVQNHALPA